MQRLCARIFLKQLNVFIYDQSDEPGYQRLEINNRSILSNIEVLS